MKGKKGQITVFIIIGIILLITVSLYLILAQKLPFLAFREQVPEELQPIKLYVEGCLEKTAEPGIMLLGLQGGYIEVPDNLKNNLEKSLPLIPNMPTSRKIPFWEYGASKDFGNFNKFMELELENYLKKELPSCLNFNSFENDFDIKALSEINPDVKIALDSVAVELSYTLEIKDKKSEKITKISKFTSVLPIRLGKMSALAADIMKAENQNTFLEELTMDMVATANTDNGRFPFRGTEITCTRRVWNIDSQLKPDLQEIVQKNFQFLRFRGTKTSPIASGMYEAEINGEIIDLQKELNDYYYTERTPVPDYAYDESTGNLIQLPLEEKDTISYDIKLNGDYSNIEVNALYESVFGMDLNVYPSENRMVTPFESPVPLVGSCIKIYNHFYTIKYPMLFILTDLSSPKPFIFNLATNVVIEKNEPNRDGSQTEDFWSAAEENYCKREEYKTSSHLISITMIDAYTTEYLEDAEITYQCLDFGCSMGLTKAETFNRVPLANSIPKLRTYFPTCINGMLVAKKQGYLDYAYELSVGDVQNPAPQTFTGEMVPLKSLDYGFEIYEITNRNSVIQKRAPREDEIIFVTLTNKQEGHEASLIYPAEEGQPEDYRQLNLVKLDTKYGITVHLFNKDGKIIGGYELPAWEIGGSRVNSAKKVIFPVLVETPVKESDEEMAKSWVDVIRKYSPVYKPVLK